MSIPRTSKIGLAVLIAREGRKLNAYKDSVGVWTIGIGHTSAAGEPKVTPGLKISAAECDAIFARDIKQYEQAVVKAVKVALADHEFDALVSICYNIGQGGLQRSSFIKRLNAGDKAGCAQGIMQWTKPAEITSRRQAERDQFLTPYSVAMPRGRSNDKTRVYVRSEAPPAAEAPPVGYEAPRYPTEPVAAPVATPEPSVGTKVSTWGKLSDAWAMLRGKEPKNTVSAPAAAATPGDPTVYYVQQQLLAKGYAGVRKADGLMGPRTSDGITLIQRHNSLPITGQITKDFLAILPSLPVRQFSEQQVTAGKQQLAEQAPSVTKSLNGLGLAGWGTLAASVLGGVQDTGVLDTVRQTADNANSALASVKGGIDTITTIVQWVVQHWWILGIVLGVYILARVGYAILKLVVMLRQGRLL